MRFKQRPSVPWPQEVAGRDPASPSIAPPTYAPMTRVFSWVRSALGLADDKLPNEYRSDKIIPVLEQMRPVLGMKHYPQAALPAGTGGFYFDVPADESWHIVSLAWIMSTDATAVNRAAWIGFRIPLPTIGTRNFAYVTSSGYLHPASTDAFYSAAPVGVFGDTGPDSATAVPTIEATPLLPLPMDHWLPPNTRISVGHDNFQAADQVERVYMIYQSVPA